MSTDAHDPEAEARLLDMLAESVWDLTDEEIVAETIADGEDPALKVDEIQKHMLGSVAKYRRGQLRQVARHRDQHVRDQAARVPTLPGGEAAQRALLRELLAYQPGYRGAVTMHHRDLRELSPEDVRSALCQLLELGAAENKNSPKDDQ